MRPILQIGSSGPDVADLQKLLNGFPSALQRLTPDGSFGSRTQNRVKEFQSQKRIVANGVVGPSMWAILDGTNGNGSASGNGASQGTAQTGSTPAPAPAGNEQAARAKIVEIARQQYQLYGWHSNTVLSPSNPRILGKRLADPARRLRQGGPQIAEIFRVAGAANPDRCLTLSEAAEKMYARSYSASERNNTDIISWCGLFTLYCYKMAGLKLSSWPLRWSVVKNASDELRLRRPGEKIEPGDIGINEPSKENHHFIVTDVQGSSISSIDGNSGALMEITRNENKYNISSVMKSGGGFLTPVWEKVL